VAMRLLPEVFQTESSACWLSTANPGFQPGRLLAGAGSSDRADCLGPPIPEHSYMQSGQAASSLGWQTHLKRRPVRRPPWQHFPTPTACPCGAMPSQSRIAQAAGVHDVSSFIPGAAECRSYQRFCSAIVCFI
jgi:hypothetical protein